MGGGGGGCLLCCRLDVNAMDDRVLVSADLLTVNAKFDHDYTYLKISETANVLAIEVKGHLNNNYQNHINISLMVVWDSLDSGVGFVTPGFSKCKGLFT